MSDRGVSRPNEENLPKGKDMGAPESEKRLEVLAEHHRKTQWIYWTIILLGVWMMMSPATVGYGNQTVSPAGDRDLWISLDHRILVLQISDLISGALLIILGYLSLKPNRPIVLWACCGVGAWLNVAPLLFWAPKAFIYMNDTLVGTLIIALTILIPGMPNMLAYMKMGPSLPPGWSYNPSSWPQRAIMIALGFAGWLVSRHLGAYQLGYIDTVWEPFFGRGSHLVLTSKISESLFISDGGLGALAYTFEFLMGWMGAPTRWRTMPWMVLFFGIVVIPLGMVHILLVISQPVVVGHWCTLCLMAAGIMLPMIPLEVDEVIGMFQYLVAARREGQSFWKVFWLGGSATEASEKKEDPYRKTMLTEGIWQTARFSVLGMSVPVNLFVTAALGIWMMAVPAVLNNTGLVADIDHLAGALTAVVSVIAMAECVRILRFLNLPLGLLLAAAPFIWSGDTTAGWINNLIVGLVVAAFSLRRGPIRQQYGSWQKYIR